MFIHTGVLHDKKFSKSSNHSKENPVILLISLNLGPVDWQALRVGERPHIILLHLEDARSVFPKDWPSEASGNVVFSDPFSPGCPHLVHRAQRHRGVKRLTCTLQRRIFCPSAPLGAWWSFICTPDTSGPGKSQAPSSFVMDNALPFKPLQRAATASWPFGWDHV